MTHIKTLTSNLEADSRTPGGCGECADLLQSACKTSCTVANQKCEHSK